MKTKTQIKTENPKNPSKKSRKLSLRENNILTKSISTAFLVLVIIGLFAFILSGLFSFGLLEMPAFIEKIENMLFGKDNNTGETQNKDADIYDYLLNKAKAGNNSGISVGADNTDNGDNFDNFESFENPVNFIFERHISLENLREIISDIPFPDNMRLETKAKYYADGITTEKTVDMLLWKKDGKYRYELRIDSKLEEIYINDGKKEYIEYVENAVTKSSVTKKADDLFSFNNIPHIPNIDYYLSLLDSLNSLKSGEIDRYRIYRHNDENIVQIRYWARALNQWETIRFSLDTGIVLSVVCYAGNDKSKYYECVTSVRDAYYNSDEYAKEQTAIADSLFVIK